MRRQTLVEVEPGVREDDELAEPLARHIQTGGLQMLALSIDKQEGDALAHLRKKGYSFPAAWLSPELARTYPKPEGLPVTVVRGKDGRVAQAEKGQLFPEDVAALARWL